MDTPTTIPTDITDLLERTRYRGAPVTWDDVVGHEPAKLELRVLAEQLRRHSVAERLGIPMTAGVLVMGPPGSGKTMLSRALAHAVDRPVHVLPTAELDASMIRRVYEALAMTPSLIVLDEADVILRSRNRPGAFAEGRLAAALCAAIDQVDPVRGPITLALTADAEHNLDRSLLRSGRLSVKVTVRRPDRAERRRILEIATSGLPVVGTLDLEAAADRSAGATGADLHAAVRTALGFGLVSGSDALEMRHLDEAILRQGHVREDHDDEDEASLRLRAVHEAGHAVMAALTWGVESVATVTLRPTGGSDGRMVLADGFGLDRAGTLGRLREHVRVRLAGTVAEELLAQDEDQVSSGAGEDITAATRLLLRLAGSLGDSELVGPVDTGTLEGHDLGRGSDWMRRSLYLEVRSEADAAWIATSDVLADHVDAIERVADATLAAPSRTLSGKGLTTVLGEALGIAAGAASHGSAPVTRA